MADPQNRSVNMGEASKTSHVPKRSEESLSYEQNQTECAARLGLSSSQDLITVVDSTLWKPHYTWYKDQISAIPAIKNAKPRPYFTELNKTIAKFLDGETR